jgi:hypothetical protein
MRARPAEPPPRGLATRVTGDSLLGLAIAAGLCLLAFTTTGGDALGPNTWSQIVLVVIAGGLGAAVLVVGPRAAAGARSRWAVVLGLFAALAVLTYASIAWSVQPADSWVEANRTLSYLAVFGSAIALARLAPGRWRGVIGGLALYSLVVCGWALLTKVFPASLDASDNLGRVRAPFDYYNAVGLAAALGLPAWLWVGAAWRRGEGARSRLAAVGAPLALAVLLSALILSYGRGALAAAFIGLAAWFALVPIRLRGALILGLGGLGGLVLGVWATREYALSHDYAPETARTTAGHHFGIVLIVVLVVLTAISLFAAVASERVQLSAAVRRRIGLALIGLVALVPVAGVVALVTSSRGFTGEISHLWHELTNRKSGVPNSPGRLAQLGSSRPSYWGDGMTVGEHHPVAGAGAFGFATAVKRYSADKVSTAHSYIVQTFADLGVIGLLVSAALLVAWGLAVRRVLRVRAGPEGVGLVTLLSVAVIFGVHSAIDWTWFIPGVAVPGLLCAGWLVGAAPVGSAISTPAGSATSTPAGSATSAPAGSAASSPARGRLSAPRLAAATAVAAATLLAAWFVWQPLRSNNADTAAVNALVAGNGGAALTDARTAADADPVDIQPHQYLAQIYAALGDRVAARAELVKATQLQPENPDAWLQLALFDRAHGRSADAAAEARRAHDLEPHVKLGL